MRQDSNTRQTTSWEDPFGDDLMLVIDEYLEEAHEVLESENRMIPRFFFELEEDLIPARPDFSDQDLRARSLEVAQIYARAFWPLRIALLTESWQPVQDGSLGEFVFLRMETPNWAHEAYCEVQRDHFGRYRKLGDLTTSENPVPAHGMTGFYPDHVPTPTEQAAARAWLAPTYGRLEIERVARTPRPHAA